MHNPILLRSNLASPPSCNITGCSVALMHSLNQVHTHHGHFAIAVHDINAFNACSFSAHVWSAVSVELASFFPSAISPVALMHSLDQVHTHHDQLAIAVHDVTTFNACSFSARICSAVSVALAPFYIFSRTIIPLSFDNCAHHCMTVAFDFCYANNQSVNACFGISLRYVRRFLVEFSSSNFFPMHFRFQMFFFAHMHDHLSNAIYNWLYDNVCFLCDYFSLFVSYTSDTVVLYLFAFLRGYFAYFASVLLQCNLVLPVVNKQKRLYGTIISAVPTALRAALASNARYNGLQALELIRTRYGTVDAHDRSSTGRLMNPTRHSTVN